MIHDFDDEEQAAESLPRRFNCIGGIKRAFWKLMKLSFVSCLLMAPGTIDIILAIYHRGAVPSNSDVSDSVSPIPLTQQTVLGRKSLFFWSIFVLGCYYSFNILYIICGFLPAFLSVSYSALYGQLSPRFQNIIDYVRELCLYITMFLYFLLLTIVWIALYGSFLAEGNSTVLNIFATGLTGSVFILIQKLLVQIIAVRFHKTAFADRLKSNAYILMVISTLNSASKKILREKSQVMSALGQRSVKNVGRFNIKTTAKIGKRIEDDRLSIKSDKNVDTSSAGKKQRNHRRTASDSEVKEAPREFRTDLLMVDKKDDYENSGSVIIDLSENVSPSATTSNLELVPGIEKASEQKAIPNIHSKPRDLNDKNLFSVLAKQVVMLTSSSKEAGKLARRIFEALCYDTKQFLYRHTKTVRIAETSERPAGALIPLDFSPFFENQEESFRAFCVFDKNKNGFITRQDIKDTIVDYHKERQSLSASLRDMSSAVGKLDIVLTVLSLVLTVLSGLLIFGVSLGPYLVTSVSVIVAIAVILGNSARNMFEGMVFLFVTHPFDVGDRVMVDNNSFIVKELGILTTVFQMWNGQVVYSPNSVLASKAIVNIRRSSCQTEVLEIHIAFSTAPEKLKELENRINDWLASESRDFSPTMKILPYEIENMNKIKIQLLLEHRSNWQEMEKRWARRSKFLLWLKDTLVDIGISYTYPVQPFTNKV